MGNPIKKFTEDLSDHLDRKKKQEEEQLQLQKQKDKLAFRGEIMGVVRENYKRNPTERNAQLLRKLEREAVQDFQAYTQSKDAYDSAYGSRDMTPTVYKTGIGIVSPSDGLHPGFKNLDVDVGVEIETTRQEIAELERQQAEYQKKLQKEPELPVAEAPGNAQMAASQPYNMGVGAYTQPSQPQPSYGNANTMVNGRPYDQNQKVNEISEDEWELRRINKELEEKQRKLRLLERPGKLQELTAVTENEDFKQYKRYQSTAVDGTWAKATSQYGMGYGDLTYEYINDTPGVRDKVKGWSIATLGITDTYMLSGKGYEHMTQKEVGIYNYLYRKNGKQAAEEYLDLIQEELNKRKGGEIAKKLEDKTLLELGYGMYAGARNEIDGILNTANFTDDYIPVSSAQFASQGVREDLKYVGPDLPDWLGGGSLGQAGYDFAYTTGNMLPSIALDMAAPGAGRVATGVSAAGNAYQSMLNEGYSKEQARSYGTLVGLSEVLMEKFLNGVPQMGKGVLPEKALQGLSKLDNVFGRVARSKAGQIAGSVVSEGFEEALQEILEPMIKSAITGEAAETEWENVLYSAFLGGMSGGAFQGVNIATESAAKRRATADALAADPQALVTEALEINPGNTLAQKLKKKLDAGKKVSSYDLLRLAAMNDKNILKQDRELINSAIQERLTELGENANVEALSKALTKQAAGDLLTLGDLHLIKHSTYGQRVSNELNPENIRSGEYTSGWAEQIGTENIRREDFNRGLSAEEDVEAGKSDIETDDPVIGADKSVIELGKTVTEPGKTRTEPAETLMEPEAEPVAAEQENISVAEKIRQQEMNGGNDNVENYRLQLGAAFTDEAARENVSDGVQGRNAGPGTGKQAGTVAAGPGGTRPQTVGGAKTFIQRKNAARNLWKSGVIQPVSSKDLGVEKGTDTKNVLVYPDSHWDAELQDIAARIKAETDCDVTFVVGKMEVQGADGKAASIRGVYQGNGIIVQLDNALASPVQLADHEAFHWKKANTSASLMQELKNAITQRYSEQEFQKVLDTYIEKLWPVYGVDESASWDEMQAAYDAILEEVLADAYAGINAFGAHADKFTEVVNQKMDELYIGKQTKQENGTRETNGPPRGQKENTAGGGVRYSLDYEDAIDQLDDGTLDRTKNTHLLVLDHTPQLYIDRAGAKNLKIITGWDIAYLAMNREGTIPGNYHSLGPDVMKKIPQAIQDPLYIVKQNNGRIAAVTEITVKGNRSVVVSIEFDSFKSTTQDGKFESDNYNLVLTMLDAKPNYLKNTIFGGDIVYNKNNEDPANFILRLKSLKKAMSNDDLAEPSNKNLAQQRPVVKEKSAHDSDKSFEEQYGLKLPTLDVDADSSRKQKFSVDDTDNQATIGELQMELYQLQHQRRSILESNTAYATASESLRYANTFSEKVAARKAMAAAKANIDTADIDQRISQLNDQINEIRTRETRQHREDQEKYSGTKTAGYSTMPDTRLKNLDRDYMKAVKDGNRAQMAKLVEQAAETAMPASVVRDQSGRLLKVYHHTGNTFTVFDRNMARTGTEVDGFFFAPDPHSTSEYGANMITAYLNITKLAMDPKLDRKFNDSGTLLREKLAYQGYDGMARTENGEIYEYMAFDPEQIKSAELVVYDDRGRVIPLSERFNFRNSDIRYSVDDSDGDEDYEALESQWNAESKKAKDAWWEEKLGEEGYLKYKQEQAKKREQNRQAGVEKARKRNAEKAEKVTKAEEKRLREETKPTRAKKNLRRTLMDMFSIPDGQRAQMGSMIESYADRLIKNGTLTEDDRRHFFDRMYESGVMTVPADAYYADARSYIKDGRIFVPESVVAEFGDDWGSMRRRAFAAGVYLTTTRDGSTGKAVGIDVWNNDLAAELPGLFDSEDTDQAQILERIVQIAEEGRDEKVSLAEYTKQLAQQEYVSEREILDNMERQMDWALRTFASEAGLEIALKEKHIKDTAALSRENIRQRMKLAQEREQRRIQAENARNQKTLREMQQKTLKTLRWLNKNRNRAPEELRAAFDEVLADIDLYAVGAANEMNWSDKYGATWRDLSQMYKDAKTNDPNFLPSEELEKIVARLDKTKLESMDLGALNDLYKAAVGLQTEFHNRNNVINDELNRLFAEVYTDVGKEIKAAPGGYTDKALDKFFNQEQLTPMNVMQRMGGWDPKGAFYSMAKQLERGERDMRAYVVKAQRFLREFMTEHGDWMKRADGQGKDAIWYEIEVPELLELGMGHKPVFGDTIKVWMTPMQKVHMYLESKNVDNLRHMTGGRTFPNKDLYSKGKRQEAMAQGKTIRMAPETVKAIVSKLTTEEMELARLLDQYYNSFATQEINRVSNILYGYDKAMGSHYAPIYTNRNYVKAEFGVFDQTAEGVGNLKERSHGVNPSYNISAIEAFEKHIDQTARFVGMAIPARNWNTLMNWRERNNSTGDIITHKWGEAGKNYIIDLINTLQSGESVKTDSISSAAGKLQSNYISAVFGANPSIVLKQLGSIPMAGAYLGAENAPSISQLANTDRELIAKYTQDLEWRTMGYATPETKQLKDNPNWTQTNKFFRFTFGGGAITAMDGWAASTLWPWAENKVRREHPELEIGTQEQIDKGESPFYKKVAEEFENAMARSQSTSDEIHQSSLRKSKNPITRAFTLFRSDSAQTYNAIRQKIGEAQFYKRTGASKEVQKAANKAVGTAIGALAINAIWAEAISFLMAMWKNKGKKYRDEEDELTAASIFEEAGKNILGSFAGTVAGGEEIFEVIGNIVSGDKWYGIDVPGVEALVDVVETMMEAGSGMRDIVADGYNVVRNGGDLGEYLRKNRGAILGEAKNVAETMCMYFGGLPVGNVESYLMGFIKWVSPELGTGYDDLFDNVTKSDLSGLKGDALTARVGRILEDRKASESDETAKILADLYEQGYRGVIPSNTPASVSVNGEERKLNAYQQQFYEAVWGKTVADALDELVQSEEFQDADAETQEKMLSKLYGYAAECAKSEVFDDYEADSTAARNKELIDSGLDLHEVIAMQANGADADDFLDFVENGMDSDDAYDLANELAELEPIEGEDRVTNVQEWRTCVKFSTNEGVQLAALAGKMTPEQFAKCQMAYNFGVTPDHYVRYYEIRADYDKDGNGSYSGAEVKAAIDSMRGLTTKEKSVLWQIATGSKSTKNNPYDKQWGQKVIDARNKG